MTQPTTRQLWAWTLFAFVLAVAALFTPWPWVWVLPVAWFFWVVGRRIAGVGPDGD